MSRAEQRVPPAPRIGQAIRESAVDLYFNSIRLVAANVVWGVTVLLSLLLATRSPVYLPVLVVPIPVTAGLMGMAVTLHRRGRLHWSDFWDSLRGSFRRTMGVGVAQLAVTGVAAFDIGLGLGMGAVAGTVLVIVGAYTLLGVWLLGVTTWPLLLDPIRRDDSLRSILRLGALLVVAHPIRMGLLALGLGVFMVASTVLVAALVTVSGAYAMLVVVRYVLPAADRLQGRATLEVEGGPT